MHRESEHERLLFQSFQQFLELIDQHANEFTLL